MSYDMFNKANNYEQFIFVLHWNEEKNHNFLNININKKTHVLQIISSNYIIIIIICYAHTKYMNNNCKKQKPTLNNCQKKKNCQNPKETL